MSLLSCPFIMPTELLPIPLRVPGSLRLLLTTSHHISLTLFAIQPDQNPLSPSQVSTIR